jgi:hypothetical protein
MTVGYGLGMLAVGLLMLLIVVVCIFNITNPKQED